jgi:hypothetical protein
VQRLNKDSKANEEVHSKQKVKEDLLVVVNEYMSFYDSLIDTAIRRNNQKIYRKLDTFIQDSLTKLAAFAIQKRELNMTYRDQIS